MRADRVRVKGEVNKEREERERENSLGRRGRCCDPAAAAATAATVRLLLYLVCVPTVVASGIFDRNRSQS